MFGVNSHNWIDSFNLMLNGLSKTQRLTMLEHELENVDKETNPEAYNIILGRLREETNN